MSLTSKLVTQIPPDLSLTKFLARKFKKKNKTKKKKQNKTKQKKQKKHKKNCSCSWRTKLAGGATNDL